MELQRVTQRESFCTQCHFTGPSVEKQDVRKANSDERAILGMKMKRELENMLLVHQFEVFHLFFFLLLLLVGSFRTSDES